MVLGSLGEFCGMREIQKGEGTAKTKDDDLAIGASLGGQVNRHLSSVQVSQGKCPYPGRDNRRRQSSQSLGELLIPYHGPRPVVSRQPLFRIEFTLPHSMEAKFSRG